MTSQDIKCKVLYHFLFEKGWIGGFTESFWNSDVLGLTKKFYTVEAEVKVSKGDLQGEIKIIQELLKGNHVGSYTKRFKHEVFLGKRATASHLPTLLPPNYYYFAVPTELVTLALLGTSNTPYGVLEVNMYQVSLIKRANLIHKGILEQEKFIQLMRKVSIENYYLRDKLRK